MEQRPEFLKSGERARLFPVLADTSKEGRTLSVVLSCVGGVQEFGAALFSSIGRRLGVRTKVDVYTEVVFRRPGPKGARPDGLIVLTSGSRTWSALIEAKVGRSELDEDQIETYLQLAAENDVDAIITISNAFTVRPDHHPLRMPKARLRKIQLFHWSWMHLLTQATLLLSGKAVGDTDQANILAELVRFLSHPSTGVRGFERMPPPWSDIIASVRGDAALKKSSDDVQSVVAAWHQEVRDLCLIMSRLLETSVDVKLSRTHQADAKQRLRDDIDVLVTHKRLRCELDVPDTANLIVIEADLLTRCILISMKLAAPSDKKSSQARINWLVRQLAKSNSTDVQIRAIWPGKAAATQASLDEVRADVETLIDGRKQMVLTSLEVLLVRQLGAKFSGQKTFIDGLEAAVPDFYEQAGQYLRAWSPAAPRLREKTEPQDVSTAAIQSEFESSEDTSEVHSEADIQDPPSVS